MIKTWEKLKIDYLSELINRIFDYTDLVIKKYIETYTFNEKYHNNDIVQFQLISSFIKYMKEDGYINPNSIIKNEYDEIIIISPYMTIGIRLLGSLSINKHNLKSNKTLLWDTIVLIKENIYPIVYKKDNIFLLNKYDYYSDNNTAVIE